MELEDLHAAFVLRAPEVDLLDQLQTILVLPELFGIHFDGVVSVLYDQQVLLDDDLDDPSEILDLWAL